MRIIAILGLLLVCGAAVMIEAKPIFIKVFAPTGGYSSGTVQSTASVAPVNTQLISNLISTKIQILNSLLRAKTSGGTFGFNKVWTFSGTGTTTTARPVTEETTEVNTDFIPEVSSSTQSVSTTTTEVNIETPKPTVHPLPPVTTSTPVIPTKSTTETTEHLETTTDDSHGYSYRTPAGYY